MRFVTFLADSGPRAGVVEGDTIRALPRETTLQRLVEAGTEALPDAGAAALRRSSLVVPLSTAQLFAPLPAPPTIRDYMTFEEHVEGVAMLAGADVAPRWYEAPAFYFTHPGVVRGPLEDVPVPPGCELFDLELEVAAVIGAGGSDLLPEEAASKIAGYMLMNDWSARDLQFEEMTVRLGPAKGKDGATSLGPYLVTPDELIQGDAGSSPDAPLTARIHGEDIGHSNLAGMSFTFGQMIAYASRGRIVRAGDIFGSGTCGGGCLAELWGRFGRNHHAPLRPGDVVELDGGPLGHQRSRVVPGAAGIEPSVFRAKTALGLLS